MRIFGLSIAALALIACQPQANIKVAAVPAPASMVKFSLDIGEDSNEQFRQAFIQKITQVQLRGEGVGLNLEVSTSPNYEVDLAGACAGAVEEIRPLVGDASAGLATSKVIAEGYARTAVCSKYDPGPRPPILIGNSSKPAGPKVGG